MYHPLELCFHVGYVYESTVATNPADLFGFGTWTLLGPGRTVVCVDVSDPDFDAARKTLGSKTHVITTGQLPPHNHPVTDTGHSHLTQRYPTATGGNSGFTIDTSMSGTPTNNTLPTASATTGISIGNTGGGAAIPIVQPSIALYRWERTA